MSVTHRIIHIYLDINYYWSTIDLYPINVIFLSSQWGPKYLNCTMHFKNGLQIEMPGSTINSSLVPFGIFLNGFKYGNFLLISVKTFLLLCVSACICQGQDMSFHFCFLETVGLTPSWSVAFSIYLSIIGVLRNYVLIFF